MREIEFRRKNILFIQKICMLKAWDCAVTKNAKNALYVPKKF